MSIGPLIVKLINSPAVGGRKALALCTEDGAMVGRQTGSVVTTEVDAMATINVCFHIDGETIRFADSDG